MTNKSKFEKKISTKWDDVKEDLELKHSKKEVANKEEKKKEVKKEESKEYKNPKLEAQVRERGVCSLCSKSINGGPVKMEKSDKKYEGKHVYTVECQDKHPELQSPSTAIVEDKEKGFVEVVYGSLPSS